VAFLLFLNGSTPDIEESDDEENGADSGDSDGGGSSYEPSSYDSSGSSSDSAGGGGIGSVDPGFRSFGEFCTGLLFICGLIWILSHDGTVSNRPDYSTVTQSQYSEQGSRQQQSQKALENTPEDVHNHWNSVVPLNLPGEKKGLPLTITSDQRLMSGEQEVFSDFIKGRSSVLSDPSPNKRYQLLLVCGSLDCNTGHLIDLWDRQMAEVFLLKTALNPQISWSPDSKYAVLFSAFGHNGQMSLVNIRTMRSSIFENLFLRSVFVNEFYDDDSKWAPPTVAFDSNTLIWKSNTDFQIEGAVTKLYRGRNYSTSTYSDGKVIIAFSVLDMKFSLVERLREDQLDKQSESIVKTQLTDKVSEGPELDLRYMLPEDAEAAQEWLYNNQRWRMLTKSDCQCDDYLPQLRKFFDNRHPYYAAGDFNGDGKLDFAIVVMDKETKTLGVAVFKGPVESRAEPDVLRMSWSDPSRTLLFYDSIKSRLLVGNEVGQQGKGLEIKSDNGIYRFQPVVRPICGTKNSGSWQMCLDAPERRYK
jgi:hypothetical protein